MEGNKSKNDRYKIIVSGGDFPKQLLKKNYNNIKLEKADLSLILESKNNEFFIYKEGELENILSDEEKTKELLSNLKIGINNEDFFKIFSPREKFYEILKTVGPGKIKTSQPNIEDFKGVLRDLNDYKFIIISTISSKLSGTYQTALKSLEEISERERNKIFVLDSKVVSEMVGLFAYEHLNKIVSEKENLEIIKDKEYEYDKDIFMRGLIFDVRYIDAGGRGGALKKIINYMKIIPLITLENGEVKLLGMNRGEKKSLNSFEDVLKEELDKKPNFYNNALMIYTSKNTKEKLSGIKEVLEKNNIEVDYVCSDFVLGTHFGAESIGFFLYKK